MDQSMPHGGTLAGLCGKLILDLPTATRGRRPKWVDVSAGSWRMMEIVTSRGFATLAGAATAASQQWGPVVLWAFVGAQKVS